MKTIYQIFAIILIVSFICFAFSSCVSSRPVSKLHSCNENDDANTSITLNKQILSKLDTVFIVNEIINNEDDDDNDDDDDDDN